jgi:tetratricopeptide (TPR) repeat protein
MIEIKEVSPENTEALTRTELFEKGQNLIKEYSAAPNHEEAPEKLETAEGIFNFLMNNDVDNVYVLFHLATVQMVRGNRGVAIQMMERVVHLLAEFPEAWNNLGYLYEHENFRDKALACFNKALAICPDATEFWNNLATLYVNEGNPDKAIEYCTKAIEYDENNTDAHWNRALAYLENRNWVDGFEEYQWGLKDEGKRKKRNYAGEGETPEWEGTADKSVVVYGEQGLGDEIMFASCFPDLEKAGAKVIYDAHPRLMKTMRRSFDFPVYGTRKKEELYWPGFETIDAKLAIGSMARFFRKTDQDFPRTPYLKPDPEAVARWKEKLDTISNRPKIGISWKGGSKTTRRDLRSIPLEQWMPIFNAVNCEWISLQYTEGAPYVIKALEEQTGVHIHHWQDCIDDLDESYAGLFPALDLVISVCTSAVHLCGAMGVKCWCLTPSAPAWRYAIKGPMPWYGSVKMYRQKGSWEKVIERVAKDLVTFEEAMCS